MKFEFNLRINLVIKIIALMMVIINHARAQNSGPGSYQQIITSKSITKNGLFKVHSVEGKNYFELPDTLLGRDFLIVNRIAKSAVGQRSEMLGFAGDEISKKVIRFEKGAGDKLFIKQISYQEVSADSSSNGLFRSLSNSTLQPIIASFAVKAYHNDALSGQKSTLIDFTDYLNGDNDIFYFGANSKKEMSIGSLMQDRSYLKNIRVFPNNVEILSLRTYSRPGQANIGEDAPSVATFELNSSIILLPLIPMRPRYADPRVGYFTRSFTDFDSNSQGVNKVTMAVRWRMEPRDEDIEKYKQGILVEPKKQIVFYIDPATPAKWVPYMISGINKWQKAFEKAGFKNAIVAKTAPADTTWSLEDALHNAIVYKPSEIANAFGPNINDPRSGEILEAHIGWHHNMLKLLHSWYMIQAGPLDKGARNMKFDDELMGKLVEYIATHEAGHTLGLDHNFGSSSTVPVEKLRDKHFISKYGHTPSIMDYARFNYVAQPEDGMNREDLFPRLGDYDIWAIEWGYRWMPEYKTAEEEALALNRLTTERIRENPRLWFGKDGFGSDPRTLGEDLGNDAVLAGNYGIKNLKRVLPQIRNWTRSADEDYGDLKEIYNSLIGQYNNYMQAVAKNIGGSYYTPKNPFPGGKIFSKVPYKQQKAAMRFLNKELFNVPKWLFDDEVIAKTDLDLIAVIKKSQHQVFRKMLNNDILIRLIQTESTAKERNYNIFNLFEDFKTGIWAELDTHKEIDLFKRVLQKVYVEQFIALSYTKDAVQQSDITNVSLTHISELNSRIKKAIPFAKGLTRSHLQYLALLISQAKKGNPIK